MNENQYRQQWLRHHKAYENRALRILMRTFKSMARTIPFERLNSSNYDVMLGITLTNEPLLKAYFDIYTQVGLLHGKRVGRGINKDLKAFDPTLFERLFSNGLSQWLLDNIGTRITLVHESFIEYIRNIILTGLNDGKSMSTIATELEKLINRRYFYRWQALRIARTETTTAANRGAVLAGETSGVLMEKVWVSAQDFRTRVIPEDSFDHLHMNGVAVGQDENFVVRGLRGDELMLYPGDPKGSAGNIINCRCSVGFRPKRDSQGRIIRTR